MAWSGPQRRRWCLGALAICLGCGSPALKPGAGVDAARPVPGESADVVADDIAGTTSPDVPIAGRGPGQPCGMPGECLSGHCVDGVCCEQSCDHPCFGCSFPGHLGQCVPLRPGIPPRSPEACPKSDPSTCGLDGTCDGQGDCRRYLAGTECGPSLCEQAARMTVSWCDGHGGCTDVLALECAPYGCDPDSGSCRSACTTDSDCAPSYPCLGGLCGSPQRPTCHSDDECTSGFCRQSVCCESSCDDPCMACDLPGSVGRCVPVADGGCPSRFDAGAGQ